MEQQHNEYLELNEIKPTVSKNGIFFPAAVEHVDLSKYHGDARSFGYNFDEGACTVVTYEQAVGVLAEDTIAMFEECAEMKHFMKEPCLSTLEEIENGHNCDEDNAELVTKYDNEKLYKDEHGFFFRDDVYEHGALTRVTTESVEIFLEVNAEYQRSIKQYNEIMKEALKNIELLKETI